MAVRGPVVSAAVTDRELFLHEYVDIVGEGAMRYMEHTAGLQRRRGGRARPGPPRHVLRDGLDRSVAAGRQHLGVHRRPRRLAAADGVHQPLAARATRRLNEWWTIALEVRSGGFDRLLGGRARVPDDRESCAATG